jgi:hypothetical protein
MENYAQECFRGLSLKQSSWLYSPKPKRNLQSTTSAGWSVVCTGQLQRVVGCLMTQKRLRKRNEQDKSDHHGVNVLDAAANTMISKR